MSAKSPIFLSFAENSLLENQPENELKTAITKSKRAKYAQPE